LKKVHPRKHNDYEVLANSMMPEAYEHGGKLARVFTVLGFAVSVVVVLLERA
jgi:ZIP family zinc transporter